MVHVPPEIKALIVDDIWYSQNPEPSLSALGLVWKNATPFIRSHRFNDIHISTGGWPRLRAALEDHLTCIATLIRKLDVGPHSMKNLILGAINLEALTCTPDYSLSSISSLATHTNLTSLTLAYGYMRFSDLMDLLYTIPRLASLTLSHFVVDEFYFTAQEVWPFSYDFNEEEDHFILGGCKPLKWEAYKFKDSDPLPNISHLSLDVSRADHLLILDYVCSPKSPFRNLQQFGLSDSTGSFMAARVEALLKKYSSSLVMFEIREDDVASWARQGIFPLTLPAGVEHFKFFVNITGKIQHLHPGILYDNIKGSCDTLKHVTMHICLQVGKPKQKISDVNAELDSLMVSLELQRFDVQVDIHCEKGDVENPAEYAREKVASIFPLITAKFLEEGASGKILWEYKGKRD